MTKPNPIGVCRGCGNAFERGSTRKKYCSLECRVWPRVAKGTDSECWPWTGALNACGYGQFNADGLRLYAHRVVYELTNGELAPEADVRHTCDNPPCCNPSHLIAGTTQDNIHDMWSKGRARIPGYKGEDCHKAVFTEQQVLLIRARADAGESIRGMAREYGVSQGAIQGIAKRRSWRHIPG